MVSSKYIPIAKGQKGLKNWELPALFLKGNVENPV